MMATHVLMAARTVFPSVPPVFLRILNPLKVYNAIHKVQDELYSTPEDGADFLAKLEAEPGMFVRRTFDNLGRIVDVSRWIPPCLRTGTSGMIGDDVTGPERSVPSQPACLLRYPLPPSSTLRFC